MHPDSTRPVEIALMVVCAILIISILLSAGLMFVDGIDRQQRAANKSTLIVVHGEKEKYGEAPEDCYYSFMKD